MVKGFQAQQQGSSYIIFLMRRATDPGEFSISPLLLHLFLPAGSFPSKSTRHNAASQHAIRSLFAVNTSPTIPVSVTQNNKSVW